ncbi:MAG: transglutaminase family protein [Pseudomonadota bacterium]
MSIRVALTHRTRYRFDRRVAAGPHVVRLRPAPHCRTPVLSYSLGVSPQAHFINWQQDPFGNYLARVVFPEPVTSIAFDVDVVADLSVVNPFDFFLESYAQQAPFGYDEAVRGYLAPYLAAETPGPLLSAWLAGFDKHPRRTVDFLVDVNRALQSDIGYTLRMEPGVQSCETTLERGIGSCRDSGWLLVQVLRNLGIAARFVSGYLVQLRADEKALDGPSGAGADFTDLHAWAEAYVPGAGWIGLDPTSGLLAGEGHLPLACAPDPVGAAPVTGAVDPCEVEFDFANTVERVHEDPRVTAPYSDAQWAAIDMLGARVDAELTDADVRLTMGGEPTFVSVDDMESPEWNTEALGDHKRRLAGELAARLQTRFGAGGLMHFAQGKWYPGEVLPRWAMTCYWRRDGEPLWRHPEWLGSRPDTSLQTSRAAQFGARVAELLPIEAGTLLAGHEDTLYYLWREGTLPPDLELGDADGTQLADPLERARLRRVLAGQLGKPVGYALPLACEDGQWLTEAWQFRRESMFLLPGDSPMGYRLPLASLPMEPESIEPTPLDPFAPRADLPRLATPPARAGVPHADDTERAVRTALCFEVREGFLNVFLPPIPDLEAALQLLGVIERVAGELHQPVRLEGYPLPSDPRLTSFQVTPDPGVIEVNVQPSASWAELCAVTQTLYAEARQSRLGTEKFMLDGRHTGTGGGNHVTLGAADAASSPLLRRPDLLASLLTYWQHHPSLSYLFSGAFIGPTSQAPRVDEARDDTLYELGVALRQVDALGTGPGRESAEPWLVDRIFRNLLVDVTGNTHRAEFCIDKLYDPGGPSGRRGLLELRAFEMPPHARMSLVQMLLVRTLVAWFWREPFRLTPARFGDALHDRFLLPHFVYEDTASVARDLERAGYTFDVAWLAPFFEFRFPRFGTVHIDGMSLELRFAIEPWHVLGEEAGAQGTARYVDSSVERLQARVVDFNRERYALYCNGQPVPLASTGAAGEFVAGVRYKAWQPASALHPSVASSPTLTFDIIDRANARAVGGCRYHVSHPGGRNFDELPVNAAAAEARRSARFEPHGHRPGPLALAAPDINPHMPHTLDLRATSGHAKREAAAKS